MRRIPRAVVLTLAVTAGGCNLTNPAPAERTDVRPDPAMEAANGPTLRLGEGRDGGGWWEAFAYERRGGDLCVWTVAQNGGNGGSCDVVPGGDQSIAGVTAEPLRPDGGSILVSGLLALDVRRLEIRLADRVVEADLMSLSELTPGILGFVTMVPPDVQLRALVAYDADGNELQELELMPARPGPMPTPEPTAAPS